MKKRLEFFSHFKKYKNYMTKNININKKVKSNSSIIVSCPLTSMLRLHVYNFDIPRRRVPKIFIVNDFSPRNTLVLPTINHGILKEIK